MYFDLYNQYNNSNIKKNDDIINQHKMNYYNNNHNNNKSFGLKEYIYILCCLFILVVGLYFFQSIISNSIEEKIDHSIEILLELHKNFTLLHSFETCSQILITRTVEESQYINMKHLSYSSDDAHYNYVHNNKLITSDLILKSSMPVTDNILYVLEKQLIQLDKYDNNHFMCLYNKKHVTFKIQICNGWYCSIVKKRLVQKDSEMYQMMQNTKKYPGLKEISLYYEFYTSSTTIIYDAIDNKPIVMFKSDHPIDEDLEM